MSSTSGSESGAYADRTCFNFTGDQSAHSEGTAELIERLIVTCLKRASAATPEAREFLKASAAKIDIDLAKRLGVPAVLQLMRVIGDSISGETLTTTGLSSQVGPEATQLVVELCEANWMLYRLKDDQAAAARCPVGDAEYLLALIRRDLALCKMRAEVRAKLNVALGGQSSGESVKNYGG